MITFLTTFFCEYADAWPRPRYVDLPQTVATKNRLGCRQSQGTKSGKECTYCMAVTVKVSTNFRPCRVWAGISEACSSSPLRLKAELCSGLNLNAGVMDASVKRDWTNRVELQCRWSLGSVSSDKAAWIYSPGWKEFSPGFTSHFRPFFLLTGNKMTAMATIFIYINFMYFFYIYNILI